MIWGKDKAEQNKMLDKEGRKWRVGVEVPISIEYHKVLSDKSFFPSLIEI